MEDSDDLQILDVENYSQGKEIAFSHHHLVMRAMLNCLDAGCKEMRAGWVNKKYDRVGNLMVNYVEDTRKHFIESVKSAYMIMICDFDAEAEKNIKDIKDKLETKFNDLCEEEKTFWTNVHPDIKLNFLKQGISYRKGNLNTELYYYQDYISEEVESYRRILEELTKLTKRLDFYHEADLEN